MQPFMYQVVKRWPAKQGPQVVARPDRGRSVWGGEKGPPSHLRQGIEEDMWFLPNGPIVAEREVPLGRDEVVYVDLIQTYLFGDNLQLRIVHPIASASPHRKLFQAVDYLLAHGLRE